MAKQSVATSNSNVDERRAFVLRLYKKFPHLFKKTSQAHNPKTFSLSLSATREKVEEAFQNLKLCGNHTDLVGFKRKFSLYCDAKGEIATKSNVSPETHSRISNDNDVLDDSLFPFKNVIVKPANSKEITTEPTTVGTICGDDKESVVFDFGDDYGNHWEFAELEKEVVFEHASLQRVSRRTFKDSKYRVEDIYKLSSQEEMCKEFVKNYLF